MDTQTKDNRIQGWYNERSKIEERLQQMDYLHAFSDAQQQEYFALEARYADLSQNISELKTRQ